MDIFLFNLIATALLYCTPIMFLRYVIFKRRIEKKKALAFVVVSAIIVFIGIRVYTDYRYGTISTNTFPVYLWCIINYSILADKTKKKNDDTKNDLNPQQKQDKKNLGNKPIQTLQIKTHETYVQSPKENKISIEIYERLRVKYTSLKIRFTVVTFVLVILLLISLVFR